ncbi:hypothetical protein ACIGXM_28380 [Kitasatospora sp. NPDC052896]|uniref:hypothetical protein n=1 Tax=Kitasatospora sp. NPDC052896 TaxID=3364061 RepID=UPI0037C84E9B
MSDCSRCGEDLLLTYTLPTPDRPGLELCRWCDTGSSPTTDRLIDYMLLPDDQRAAARLMRLAILWSHERQDGSSNRIPQQRTEEKP